MADLVRILIVSDIHANLEALEACLAAAPPHNRVFNLGDIVGYGANPNEVTERARSLGEVFVRGNHDKACTGITSLEDFNPIAGLAAMWTRNQLKPDNLEFLRQLPAGPTTPMDRLQC
ncbi:MAG: metallophosphoesterase family protein, partial [Candidatus Angelobacter sp.]